jgi:tetratricopeptide (TPR) repeat protein
MDLQQRFSRIMAMEEAGDDEETLRELEGMLADTPDTSVKVAVLSGEASCLRRLHRCAEAEKRLDEAERMTNEPWILATLWLNRALVYEAAGKDEESRRMLEQIVRKYGGVIRAPEHRDLYEHVYWRLGIHLNQPGRYRESLPFLEEAVSFSLPKSEKGLVYFQLGACLYNLGELDRSKEWLVKALGNGGTAETIIWIHYYLGSVHFWQGSYAEALQEFLWCEPRIERSKLERRFLYGFLAKTFSALGMKEQARIYETLGENRGRRAPN